MGIAEHLAATLGPQLPVALRAYDDSRAGPTDAAATIVIRSPDAIRRIATAPGELGLGRAYVAGDLDIEGDIFAALELRHRLGSQGHTDEGGTERDEASGPRRDRIPAATWLALMRAAGPSVLRPLKPPPEEVHLGGRRHTRERDAAAIAHHYDVSNDFYRIVLGATLTYSCAVWETPSVGLDAAQVTKHELICRKLALEPGMRLLDVGCGWGSLVMHAAAHHGVQGVGVTISRSQADLAAKRVTEAGLADQIEIRYQDYRDVHDGPYDAISSIGMFEHVGLARLKEYFNNLHGLLRPTGRLLNHGISRPGGVHAARFRRRSFIDRYVFPDGELHEVGSVVSAMQGCGFEVRHLETLREHYALTLRAWVQNLESQWDEAVRLVGAGRVRVWRLYMAACAVTFEENKNQVHQVLGVRTEEHGDSGVPLRPDFR